MVWYYVVIRGNRAEKKYPIIGGMLYDLANGSSYFIYIFFDLHFNYYFSLIFSAIIIRLNLIFFFSINFRYLGKYIHGKRKYYYDIYIIFMNSSL